jgi:uracil-DNA glycosylase
VTRKPLPMADALDAHSTSLSSCRRCESRDEGVRPILSEARAPKAMLVGQAPGKVEIYDQRAFAGRAGKTLFKWLEIAGVDEETFRAHVYIAAITRCYPGPSPSGRGDRVPSPAERHECGAWLDQELRIIRPRLVIPVGRLAIDRFLGPLPLDEVIGRVHSVEHAGGTARCIPLPHPSGASSWIHAPGHRDLLNVALRELKSAFEEVGILQKTRHPSRRSA